MFAGYWVLSVSFLVLLMASCSNGQQNKSETSGKKSKKTVVESVKTTSQKQAQKPDSLNLQSEPKVDDQPEVAQKSEPDGEKPEVESGTDRETADSTGSSQIDSLPDQSAQIDDEIVVQREQLVSRSVLKIIPVEVEDTVLTTQDDTLIQKQSSIKPVKKTTITVEYWQSPLNSKGYKMANNKLLLFGVDVDEAHKVYELQDSLYFKHFNNLYAVKPSFELLPLKPVTSKSILLQLQQ
ncbi:hypothetical protein [Salibacter halophilus]|uniref:Lipoprotein n=1 Tax=Salibacter halophilus TaxID=1803916 RepID=A0A6N6M6W9_9FLAO|nr:hypothetical protein [Salibacter halophilus]KAB1063757.1 hypothetical protein F3059_09320 [Salibacter halophilus]